VLLTASFGLTVANRGPAKLVPLHIAVQVLVFFGTPSFIEYGPRLQSSWRLAGVVDYISQHQGIDRGIDVFFNWPGFFILVSFLTQAAGLNDSLGLAEWAPMFFNLAYALPLLIMFQSLSLSDRQIWVGLWLFFAGNWIGQDYLSPQAFAYLMYLVIIAAVLTVFRASSVDAAWSATRLTAMGRLPAVFVQRQSES
jgi:hypothetical protein